MVTGGRGGLGGAVVDALVAAGATCHLPQRGATSGQSPARESVRVTTGVDLGDEAAVTAFYAGLPAIWASVHLAGGFAAAPFTDTTLAILRGQLDINLTTAFLCCREAIRKMRQNPGPDRGRIVNVSARAALVPSGGTVAYSLSKAAVNMLTQTLAEELKSEGIAVNAIAPATIDTATNRAAMPGATHDTWAKPADIAQAVAWLVSPRDRVTSGALIPVYGTAG